PSPSSSPSSSPSPLPSPSSPLRRSAALALREWRFLIRQSTLRTVVRRADPRVFAAPSFRLAPFGRSPASDCITLYANAARAESRTLFFLLNCMHERPRHLLHPGDLESFFLWFEPYAHFVRSVVALLQQVWLPRLQNCAALPPHAPAHFFAHAAQRLQRTLDKLLSHQKPFLKCAPRVAAHKLLHLFIPFANLLLTYCATVEAVSAPFIRATFSAEETNLLAHQLITHFKGIRHFSSNLVLLLRWLSNRPQTSSYWRRQYLDAFSAIRYTQWKKTNKQHQIVLYFSHKASAHPTNRYFDDPSLPSF
ncbi:unnamed protein product, partial [Agarophyton chilense]